MITKNCKTCGHRHGIGVVEIPDCLLSGYNCLTERRYNTKCDKHMSGWVPRGGVFERTINLFRKIR
jgi:hypothetical protein